MHKALGTTALAAAWLAMSPAYAHDFWIQPDDFRPERGDEIGVRLRIGHTDAPEAFKRQDKRIAGQVVDTSAVGDVHPERARALSELVPKDLSESILNFPFEVRRAYKRMNAATARALKSRVLRRPVERTLRFLERHESALAEQLSPHRMLSRYMVHDHRKLLIVDGEVAMCGGMNIGQEYLYRHPIVQDERGPDDDAPEPWPKWHDTCCLLRGPAVNGLQRRFLQMFERFGGAAPEADALEGCYPAPRGARGPRHARTGGMRVATVASAPGGDPTLEREALNLIASAKDRVLIRNPYLVRRAFIGALAAAAKSGAQVRAVLSDDHNDSFIHQGYMRSFYPLLDDAGVELREHSGCFSHAKALTADGRRTLMGSFNYNNRSAAMDFECGILVDDASFAKETERRLYHDDVHAGVAARRDGSPSLRELPEALAAMAAFEVLATFL